MSRVPTAVRKAAQQADEMIRAQAAAASGEPADTTVQATTVADGEPAESAPTAQVVNFDAAAAATTETGDESVGTTDGMQDAALEQLDAAAQEAEAMRQRWKSLDGQLRQRDAQIAAQTEQIARLTELVGNMAEGAAQAPAEPQAPAGVLPTDADDFGEDMVQFVTRVVTSVVDQRLQNVSTKVNTLEHSVQDVAKSTAHVVKDAFQESLTKLAPRWQEFDTDQRFHDWLEENPSRKSAFYAGVTEKNAAAVADWFNMFASTLPAPAPNKQEQARAQLEKQVSPKKSVAGNTSDTAEPAAPKQWTRTEIAQVYKDRANRKISDADFAKLEVEITAAQSQGRVDYQR